MTLLTTHGFDTQTVNEAGWSATGSGVPAYAAGRYGGYCVNAASSLSWDMNYVIPAGVGSTIVSGFAYRFNHSTDLVMYNVLGSDGTAHIRLTCTGTGAIEVRREPSTVLSTIQAALQFDVWHFVEVKTLVDDVSGIVVIRVDGAEVYNFTGDTRAAGTGTLSGQLKFRSLKTVNQFGTSYDDIYVLDTVGPAPYNDFLPGGDRRIFTSFLTGNGSSSQLTGSDGNSVDNYLQADEAIPQITDYNGHATAGNKDLYAITDLPTTSIYNVDAVRVKALAFKNDAGAKSAKLLDRLPPAVYSGVVLSDSPLGHWRHGDSNGSAILADSSGNSRNGTYSDTNLSLGVAGLLTGDSDTACNYNGSTEYAQITDAAWMEVSTITAESWIKPDDVSSYHIIVARDQGNSTDGRMWFLRTTDTGKAEFGFWTAADQNTERRVTGTTTLSVGSTYHLVGTYDGTTGRLYVNGTEAASLAISGSLRTDASAPIRIAAHPTGPFHFDGVIDEVALYSGALSATRILAHYNAGKAIGPNRASAAMALAASPGSVITTGPLVTDPDGAGWTPTKVNGLEIGFEVA